MCESVAIVSRSEEETLDLGKRIGSACSGGELIGLIGPLGSGKSVLARGIARGLGVMGPVRSPSFNLMRQYRGRLIYRHWDLYRLESGYAELGLLESVEDTAVVAVEWADKWDLLRAICSGSIYIDYGDGKTDRLVRRAGNVPGFAE